MASIPVGIFLGFSIFCLVCVFRPEYLASTYFIREKYSPKVTALFRLLAVAFSLGGVQMTIDIYRESRGTFGPQPSNPFVSSVIGIALAVFLVSFVRWGRERKLRQHNKQK